MNKVLAIGAAVAALASMSAAHAVPISGLGDPSGNALLTGGTGIGFDSTADGLYSNLTLSGVTFSSTGAPFTVGTDFNGNYNTTGGKSIFNGFDLTPDNFRFDFDAPVDAFAFNWGAADNTWLLSAYDSSNTLLETLSVLGTFASNAGEYYGIAASGIAYATLVDTKNLFTQGDYVFLDRFTYNQASTSVPEPSTLALFSLGLLGLAFASRRRQQQ